MPSANRHHCQEEFCAGRLTFSFPPFHLIALNYLPSDHPACSSQPDLPWLLSFSGAHLQCSPHTKLPHTGTWVVPGAVHVPVSLCLAEGLPTGLLRRRGMQKEKALAILSPFSICLSFLAGCVCVPMYSVRPCRGRWGAQGPEYHDKKTGQGARLCPVMDMDLAWDQNCLSRLKTRRSSHSIPSLLLCL